MDCRQAFPYRIGEGLPVIQEFRDSIPLLSETKGIHRGRGLGGDVRSSYDINLQNLFRLQRFFMASMRRPQLVGLSQA